MTKRELYPVQVEHGNRLAYSLESYRHALDASKTGCGKTLVGAELSAVWGKPTLVVCPKIMIPTWEEELRVRGAKATGVINYEKLRTSKTPYGRFTNSKLWEWSIPKDSLIIWDEVQKTKTWNSLNAKMLIAAKPHANLLASATCAKGPTDMRATGYILGLHNLRDYWAWCKKNGCVVNAWGALEFEGGPAEIDKIHRYIFPEHGSRLTHADMADHFKETQIITTPLDFGSKIKGIYKRMERELKILQTTALSDNPGASALTEILRARQMVELLKIPDIVEMTQDFLEEGCSVALFLNFTATIQGLAERIPGAVTLYGEMKDCAKQAAISAFQSNSARVIICNIACGGVGLSLHDLYGTFPRRSITSPSFNEMDIIQVLGRIHRAGGMTPSQQHVLFAKDTIEETVKQRLDDKMLLVETFNSGQKYVDTY